MPVDNVVIHDTHLSEWLTIAQVLAVSSNICAAKLGLGLGGIGCTSRSGAWPRGRDGPRLPGEASGTLRPKGTTWFRSRPRRPRSVTASASRTSSWPWLASAVANGGELMDPILVKKIVTANGELGRETSPHVRRRVIPEHVARSVAELLVAVTEGEGTGTEAAVNGYRVAGKTATAQKAGPAPRATRSIASSPRSSASFPRNPGDRHRRHDRRADGRARRWRRGGARLPSRGAGRARAQGLCRAGRATPTWPCSRAAPIRRTSRWPRSGAPRASAPRSRRARSRRAQCRRAKLRVPE